LQNKALERGFGYYLALIAALGLVLRTVFLAADPPLWLTWSRGIFSDGPVMISGARGLILFDDLRAFHEFPIQSTLAFLSYKFLGIGLVQATLPFALSGVLGVILMGLIGRKIMGASAGLLCALLGAVNFHLVMYSRTTLSEGLLCTGLLLSWCALECQWPLTAGILGGVATLFVKLHGVVFLVAATAVSTVGAIRDRRLGPLAHWLAGLLAALVLWTFVHVGSVQEATDRLGSRGRYYAEQHTGNYILELLRFGMSCRFLSRMPVVSLLALLVIVRTLGRPSENRRLLLPVLWVVVGVPLLSLSAYLPLRHLLQLVPPMCLLAAAATTRPGTRGAEAPASSGAGDFPRLLPENVGAAVADGGGSPAGGEPVWNAAIVAAVLLHAAFQLIGYVRLGVSGSGLWAADLGGGITVHLSSELPFLIPAAAAACVAMALRRRLFELRVPVLVAFLAVPLGLAPFLYFVWDREYTVYQVSRDLGAMLPGDAKLVGPLAETVGIENRLRSFALYELTAAECEHVSPAATATFFLVPEDWMAEGRYSRERLTAAGVHHVRSYRLAGEDYLLLRLGQTTPTVYERITATIEAGRPEESLRILDSQPDRPVFRVLRAHALEALARPQDALNEYEKADRENRRARPLFDPVLHKQIHKGMWAIYKRQGNVKEAESHWLEAEQWKPSGFF